MMTIRQAIKHDSLQPVEKIILVLFIDEYEKTGAIKLTNNQIADAISSNPASIKTYVSRLKVMGLIKTDFPTGIKRIEDRVIEVL